MRTISVSGKSDLDGMLILSLPVGSPNAAYEAVVVLQPKMENDNLPTANVWAGVNNLRQRLESDGKFFADSAEVIQELRDR